MCVLYNMTLTDPQMDKKESWGREQCDPLIFSASRSVLQVHEHFKSDIIILKHKSVTCNMKEPSLGRKLQSAALRH